MDGEREGLQLSETERHWGQICLNLLTIATAANAVVLVISGLDRPTGEERDVLDNMCTLATGIATAVYFALVVTVTRTVFPPGNTPRERTASWKQENALKAFAMFVGIAPALTVAILSTIMDKSDGTAPQGRGLSLGDNPSQGGKRRPGATPVGPLDPWR